jgi:TorA maturation chaperone TorD
VEATLATGGETKNVRQGHRHPKDSNSESDREIPDEDLQRAHIYGLLARLLAEPMSEATLAALRAIEADDSTEFGRAMMSLADLAKRTTTGAAEEEYTVLFYGVGAGGELQPYASYYLTGFLYEKPLANLRGDMAELGIAASGSSTEPEDHIAYLCEIMHGLIIGGFGGPKDLATQRKFFARHLAPWAGRFFENLEGAKSAAFYMPVGTIGKLFMGIENEAFETAA